MLRTIFLQHGFGQELTVTYALRKQFEYYVPSLRIFSLEGSF